MSTNDPTNAQRQAAYRERIKARLAGLQPPPVPTPKPPKKKARPARIVAITAELMALVDEYTSWREAIPKNLQDGEQAQRLDETIEQLQTAIDALDAIEAPRVGG
jgi:hypothetical protein